MIVKLNLKECFDAYAALNKFSTKEIKDEFLCYKMSTQEKKALKPAQLFQNIRLECVKKHGVYDKLNNSYTVPPDKVEEFQKELDNRLAEIEPSMESDLTFDTTKLSLFKGIGVSPEFFREMGRLIEE